jgi:hypothetical protein
MPHRIESFQLSGHAMALLAGVTVIHAFFSQPDYGQLRQAIENAPINLWIGHCFDKIADLRGADVSLNPAYNLWDLIVGLQKLMRTTGHARWPNGRLLTLDDVVSKLPSILEYIIRRLEKVSRNSITL